MRVNMQTRDGFSHARRGWRLAAAATLTLHIVTAAVSAESRNEKSRIERLRREAIEAYEIGAFEKAADLAQTAYEKARTLVGDDNPTTLIILRNLASIYSKQGRAPEATKIIEQIVAVQRANPGNNYPDALANIGYLAGLYVQQGRLAKAADIIKQLVAARRAKLGDQHPETLAAVSFLANIYTQLGRLTEAAQLFEQINTKLPSVFGEDHPSTLVHLSNLSVFYTQQGRLAEAAALVEQVIVKLRAKLGENHPDTLMNLSNLASIYMRQGRLAKATEVLEQITAKLPTILGENHPDTLLALGNLASVYFQRGRRVEAAQLLEKIIPKQRAKLGESHPDLLGTLNILSSIYHFQGRLEEAERLQEEVLAKRIATLGENHPETIIVYQNLASLYRAQGQFGKASRLLEKVLEISRDKLGQAHPNTLVILNSLALIHWREGSIQKAVSELNNSQRNARAWAELQADQTAAVVLRTETLTRADFAADQALALAAAAPSSETARLAADAILGWKGIVGEREAELLRLVRATDGSVIAQVANKLRLARSDLASAFFQGQRRDTAITLEKADETHKRLVAARKRVDEAEHELASKCAALNTAQPQTSKVEGDLAAACGMYWQARQIRAATASDVQAALPSDAALVEYRFYRPFDVTSQTWGPGRFGAVVLRRDSDPVFLPLAAAADLAPLVDEMTRSMGTGDGGNDAAATLHDRLIEPLKPHLKGVRTLYLAPDSFLARVPFEALRDAEDKLWIKNEIDLRFVLTGRALLRQRQALTATDLLALGIADFDAPAGTASLEQPKSAAAPTSLAVIADEAKRNPSVSQNAVGLGRFNPLEWTMRELDALDTVWREATKAPIRKLIGADANKAQLTGLAAPPRVLHLATHGFVVQVKNQGEAAEDRLALFSGVALAGANRTEKGAGIDNGVLSGFEIEMLPLDGTQLVVLSACKTGLGASNASEGVYSLARAFRISGATAVLGTLQKVNDKLTSDFMVDFYTTWLSTPNRDPAVALRMVKRNWADSSDRARSDPMTWAPFFLVQNTL